jgi:hypothetical protein
MREKGLFLRGFRESGEFFQSLLWSFLRVGRGGRRATVLPTISRFFRVSFYRRGFFDPRWGSVCRSGYRGRGTGDRGEGLGLGALVSGLWSWFFVIKSGKLHVCLGRAELMPAAAEGRAVGAAGILLNHFRFFHVRALRIGVSYLALVSAFIFLGVKLAEMHVS